LRRRSLTKTRPGSTFICTRRRERGYLFPAGPESNGRPRLQTRLTTSETLVDTDLSKISPPKKALSKIRNSLY
jgi:hypothetical protein